MIGGCFRLWTENCSHSEAKHVTNYKGTIVRTKEIVRYHSKARTIIIARDIISVNFLLII